MDKEQKSRFLEKLQTFEFKAVQNGEVPNNRFSLDKNTRFVTHMTIEGDKGKVYYRGSLGLRIGGDELYDVNTPAAIFIKSVNANERFTDIGEVPKNTGIVEFRYRDEDNAAAPWGTGYRLKVIFKTLLDR